MVDGSERISVKAIHPLMAASDLHHLWNHSPSPTITPVQLPFATAYVQKKRKRGESNAWREAEDEALMSAWCWVSTNPVLGKSQNHHTRWTKVSELYEQSRLTNPRQISAKSNEAMRSRFRRLDVLSNKWISCLKTVRSQAGMSGTSSKDEEAAAQLLFSDDNKDKKFEYVSLFNKVMSKNPKWRLDDTNVQKLHSSPSIDANGSLEAGEQPITRIVKRLDIDDVQQVFTISNFDANEPNNRNSERLDIKFGEQLDTNPICRDPSEQPNNRSLERLDNNVIRQLDTDLSVDTNDSLEGGEQPSIGTAEDVELDPETPESARHRHEGRDAVHKEHKGKSSAAFEDSNAAPYCEYCAQLKTMCTIREKEIEIMQRKIESDCEMEKARIEFEEKKMQEKNKRVEMKMLNTLVGKEHLSPAEESVKLNLLLKYYPPN